MIALLRIYDGFIAVYNWEYQYDLLIFDAALKIFLKQARVTEKKWEKKKESSNVANPMPTTFVRLSC